MIKTVLAVSAFLAASAFAADHPVIPLWANGAPGSEARASIPEKSEPTGNNEFRVSSIHNPSLTVYLPAKDKATGTAVIIAPGGGHQFLSMVSEGANVGEYLASIGVAGFVLKYRLAREPGSTYQVDREALADSQRAIRLVRSRAKEWGLDENKIGFMGFSAGGELAALVETKYDAGIAAAADPIEHASSRPSFNILIYPGVRVDKLTFAKDNPQAFLLCAFDDPGHVLATVGIWEQMQKVGVPADLHVFSAGGHGFGLRTRTLPIDGWPRLVQEWMKNRNFIPK